MGTIKVPVSFLVECSALILVLINQSQNSLLTLIRESWNNNPKRVTITERIFCALIFLLCFEGYCALMLLCFDFFPGKHARLRSQKMAYICGQHGIFPLILAYAIRN